MRTRILILGLLGMLMLFSTSAWANSATWEWPGSTGAPGPVESEHLVLEREHVRFADGRVSATFWVRNTSDEDVTTQMGFPLVQRGDDSDYHYLKENLEAVSIQSGEDAIDFGFKTGLSGEYPTAMAWEQRFPAGEVVEFTVTYPLMYSVIRYEDVGLQARVRFKYITHTGAYWAKPIGKATFEFCDGPLADAMTSLPPKGTHWNRALDKTYAVRWSAEPHGYKRKEGCLKWQFENWTPGKDDDIELRFKVNDSQFVYPSVKRYYQRWCGQRYDPALHYVADRPGEIDYAARQIAGADENAAHFAAKVRVGEIELTPERLDSIEKAAWELVQNEEPGEADSFQAYPTWGNLPTFKKLEFRKHLYRYLRNYLVTPPNGSFEDLRLETCYLTAPPARRADEQVVKSNIGKLVEAQRAQRKAYFEAKEELLSKAMDTDVFYEVVARAHGSGGSEVPLGHDYRAYEWVESADTEPPQKLLGPRPAESTPLELSRVEILLHDGRIYTRMKLHNPTDQDVRTTILAPLEYSESCRMPETGSSRTHGHGIVVYLDGEEQSIEAIGSCIGQGRSSYEWEVEVGADDSKTVVVDAPLRFGLTRVAEHFVGARIDVSSENFANDTIPTTSIRVGDTLIGRAARRDGWEFVHDPERSGVQRTENTFAIRMSKWSPSTVLVGARRVDEPGSR